MRFFNTAGPVDSRRHYCLPPLERLDLTHVLQLIDQQKYFVLHAPRQTGKTSVLLALMDHLNKARGQHRCVYVNVEVGQSAREAVAEAMRAILSELASWAETVLNDSLVDDIWAETLAKSGPHSALGQVLSRWSARDPRPLVLLIDEIDALVAIP
ncbi:MAG: ATP-binding protein [Gammaproteobacteria bacterium]